ncbi:MAG: ribosome small subunit-dependent GTPase A [Candidatus Krumholzibacteria bacterium]|nr:ribosome small subunit-dependent GTPase A [Candidatus Krumholzibacteria bacterium]MDH4338462.1 ribosome small subunit-dependent GTPase A [Candidatus Krumholzibacteria bacterium]MDH5271042.1 ribosome small subunit-dependent GTPase A [Candidatus Krumholzibacteria bacterium]
MLDQLDALGFATFFRERFEQLDDPLLVPARIASEGRGVYRLLGCRAARGELRGRLRAELAPEARPAVGDWVAVRDGDDLAIIHDVLERRTALIRRAAGSAADVQVVAANIDLVFVVTAVTRDYNPRRIERYVAAVWDGGAEPVIVLNKADLEGDVPAMLDELAVIAPGVPAIRTSTVTAEGLDDLRRYLAPGKTIGLVGSSGVGKSSIANRLLGDQAQDTRATRRDEKGRHTTTRRDLVVLPQGGLLIDTPGMREFGLVEDGGGVETLFADIAALATECHFRDCSHQGEPGCAVIAAVEAGELDDQRLGSYQKLQREIAAAQRRRDPAQAHNTKKRWKSIHKDIRRLYRDNPKYKK